AAAAAERPAGQWIRAYGLDFAGFPGGVAPSRADLDRATTDHPVLVRHVSGHHALVNTAALERQAVDPSRDPEGGRFLRDERGQPNGWCLDAAMERVLPVAVDVGNHGPNIHFEAAIDDLASALRAGTDAYLAAGLTTVCDAQVTRRELAAYREGRRRGTLGLRVLCMPLSHQLDSLRAVGVAGPFGDDWLAIGAMKFYADGALSGGTACFRKPYGRDGEYPGSLFHQPAELMSLISAAVADGWQVGVHAQGDLAIGMTLDAIAAGSGSGSGSGSGTDGGRHRIEHAGYPGDELDRFARLGVIPVSQPGYLHDFGDMFLDELGDRAHRLQPLRDQLDRGMTVVLSSDSTVSSYRPAYHIAAAVNRRTRSGRPIGPGQALSVTEALRGYTIDAARSLFAEDRLGSIEAGKLADFVVLAEDPFVMPAQQLADLRVHATVLGGEVVYLCA
ncbi:MAG: amidohydrolase, partial [Streptosporangiaceae bacterium]